MNHILRVDAAPPYTRKRFQVYTEGWDLDQLIGYGDTIPEAIEDFLECWEMKYDEQLLNYKWA